MLKKFLFPLSIIGLIFISSCSNLFSHRKSDISFSLGKDVAKTITESTSNVVADDSIFIISCEYDGLSLDPHIQEVEKKNLANASILLKDIPYNVKFTITIKVSFNGHLIYQGKSNDILITEKNDGQTVNIVISERKGTIKFECNGGDFTLDEKEHLQTSYFLNDSVSINSLPKPSKKGYIFAGWYSDKTFTNRITTLGRENYIGDVNLYALWAKVWAEPGDKSVTIKWNVPVDYNKVQIMFDGTSYDITSPTDFKKIENLANGSIYNFVVKLFYDENTSSPDKIISVIPQDESVKLLNNYNSPNSPFSGSYKYVEFGYWPQSLKSKEQVISLSSETVNVNGTDNTNGWDCYCGSDGFYYVKEGSDYFKLEPIKWRVLSTNYKYNSERTLDGRLLLAENILVNHDYHERDSRYDYSFIRSYLENDFYIKAFSKAAREYILTTSVDNSYDSARSPGEHDGYCNNESENTNDKIFLLSQDEIVNKAYGFMNGDSQDSAKNRVATDYAKTVLVNTDNQWWLRSPGVYTRESARTVHNGYSWIQEGGYIKDHMFDCKVQYNAGVVPALCIPNPAP